MRKIVVPALLIVLSIGAFGGLYARSLSGNTANNVQTQSSTIPSNIIDHLPFMINETDVYYVAKDLTVNGDGITILADTSVLIGQGYKITGNGTGNGIAINASNVVVNNCDIRNFNKAVYVSETGRASILYDTISNSHWGIYIISNDNNVKGNIIFGNTRGIVIGSSTGNLIYDNYFNNPTNAVSDTASNYWNREKSAGPNIIGGPWIGGNCWSDYAGSDSDGNGLGDTSYTISGGINNDNLPLVDINPPKHNLTMPNFAPPNVALNMTWIDNVQVSNAILEFDGINYTDPTKMNEDLGFSEYYGVWCSPVQDEVAYSRSFTNLSLGVHYYRWYANDTSNLCNATDLLSFNVTAVPHINSVNVSSILEATANITCAGVSNITQDLDQVGLHFKIGDNWYAMNMSYNASTGFYSALIPAYNELANKTIQYYVTATDKYGNTVTSDVFSYQVPEWVIADLNRDGKVDWLDYQMFLQQYGYSAGVGGKTPYMN